MKVNYRKEGSVLLTVPMHRQLMKTSIECVIWTSLIPKGQGLDQVGLHKPGTFLVPVWAADSEYEAFLCC